MTLSLDDQLVALRAANQNLERQLAQVREQLAAAQQQIATLELARQPADQPAAAVDYDLFVSYAQADRAWVEGTLLFTLERAGARYHSEGAFALGVPRLLEFERAIKKSQRTLLILSPSYLADGFSQFVDLLAQSYGLESATWPVIPLIFRPVDLPERLSMLTHLDATDPDREQICLERLCAELRRPLPGPAPKPDCPYPGMVPFRAEDARFFYGRDAEIEQMLQHLRHQRLLLVIGPSGSGKSSLVRAGLLPRLNTSRLFPRDAWLVQTFRPGDQPLTALAQALGGAAEPEWASAGLLDAAAQPQLADLVAARLAASPPAQRLLLVIDQFEELFTVASREAQQRFIAALKRLLLVQSCALLIALRADFYPDLMTSDLWPVETSQRLEVAPLRGDALREAIEQPAAAVEVWVEAGLVDRLLADAADEPGVLPLIQETMVLLWEQMRQRFLSLDSYARLGRDGRSGLAVAIATKADAAYAALAPEQQPIARRMFLRLVQFGEGRANTRRQQPLDQLRVAGDDVALFDRTLRELVDNRLLTLGGGENKEPPRGYPTKNKEPGTIEEQLTTDNGQRTTRRVDISHEALIGGWPALRGWIAERRAAEQTRRLLEDKAGDWVRLGRGMGGLLDEIELLEAERWLTSPDAAELGYSRILEQLVEASRAALAEERRQQEAARQRELKQARALAEEQARARAEAERLRLVAIAQVLALQAAHAEQAELAALLVRQAYLFNQRAQGPLLAQIDAALRAVLGRLGQPEAAPVVLHAPSWGGAMVFDPDGQTLALGSPAGMVMLWDLRQLAAGPHILQCPKSDLDEGVVVALSPDGRLLVSGGRWQNKIALWNLRRPDDPPAILHGHERAINIVVFSPDSQTLASGSADTTIRLWDPRRPEAAPQILSGAGQGVTALAFSPDSQSLASGGEDGTVRLWALGQPDAAPTVLRGHELKVSTVAFSPDGQSLASGGEDGTVRLWALGQPDAAPTVLRGHEGEISSVAFSPDGQTLASGSRDYTMRLWDMSLLSAAPRLLSNQDWRVNGMAFSEDGQTLAVNGGTDVVLWIARAEALSDRVCGNVQRNLSWDEWCQFVGGDIPYERTCPELPVHPSIIEAGRELAHQGDLDGALALLGRARALDPGIDVDLETEARHLVAQYRVSMGEERALRGDLDGTIALFQKAVELNPGLALDPEREARRIVAAGLIRARLGVPRGMEAENLIADGNFTGALAQMRRARAIFPEIDLVMELEDLIAAARSQARSGEIDAAIAILEQVDELEPGLHLNPQAEARQAAAIVRAAAGERVEAIALLEQARAADPARDIQQQAQVLLEDARELAQTGAADDALKIVQCARELDSKIDMNAETEVRLAAAQGLAIQGKPFEAIALLDQARAIDPATDIQQQVQALMEAGRELARAGALEEASRVFQYIREHDPGAAPNLEVEARLAAAVRAVELAPDDGSLRESRGLARALIGDYQGAIEDFTFFVTWARERNKPADMLSEREAWIAALKGGRNPFDQVTLERLRDSQTSA